MNDVALGVVAFACYGAHATFHLLHHRPHDLLWACHISALWIGLGFCSRAPLFNAIGVCWLSLGVPLWIVDLATGGELFPTSFLTHVGGAILGVIFVRRHGFPAGAWWKAVVALMLLFAITRAVTPAEANVNLAFSVHPGWQRLFPSYPRYFAALFALSAAVFAFTERIARSALKTSVNAVARD